MLRISGEGWKTSVLMGLRSKPVRKKKPKVQQALDFVSINLLFRGKHKCFGRQLLWPFLFLELSALKALSLWQQQPSWQTGEEEVWESREGRPLSSVFSFCPSSFVEWPSCDLRSNRNLPTLEYVFVGPASESPCLFRRVAHALRHLWPVWPEVRLRTSKSCSSIAVAGFISTSTVSRRRHSGDERPPPGVFVLTCPPP